MKRALVLAVALLATLVLMGGNCSRARVESMDALNRGVVAARQKQYIEAIEELEKATAIDPANEQAYWNLALVHMETNKLQAARGDLQKAVSIAPTKGIYHYQLGTVEMQLSEWEQAKTAFEAAIQHDPALFKAYFKLGQVLEELDDQQQALQRYTEAIQRNPRFLPAYSSLGRLYADLGYLDQAVQVLQGALQVAHRGTEEEADIHNILGSVYQQQRKYDEAVGEFRAALNIVPTMSDALFSLGWTYWLQENRENARIYLKKFVDTAGPRARQDYVTAANQRLAELAENTQ